MLIGTRRSAEPAVVSDIQQQARTQGLAVDPIGDFIRKNGFIANHWEDKWQARRGQETRGDARFETARNRDELGDSRFCEKARERHVFAEKRQVHFVIALKDFPAGDDIYRIEISCIAPFDFDSSRARE